MAAIKLEELMAGQKRLKEKSQGGERMSLSQLKELLNAQNNSADKQLKTSNEIKSLSEDSKTIQEEQLDLMVKTDQRRAKIDEVIVKTARETYKEIQKQRKATEALQKAASAESAKKVTDKAMGMERFKTIGDRVEGFKSSIKNLFTLRGFLDKSGLVKKGTGGILDTALAKREARNQYSEDRMRMEVAAGRMEDTAENRKTFKRQFDRQQVNLGKIQKNEAEIKRLQDLGYSEEDISSLGLLDEREKLAKQAAKDDKRLREKKEKPEGLSLLSSPAIKDISIGESSEDILEQNKEIQKQTELLEKIEENTRQSKDSTAKKEEKKEEKKEGGFELPSLGDLLKLGKGGLKGLGSLAKGGLKGLKGLGSLAKGGMQLAKGLPLGSMALGAAPLAVMYGVTKWAEGASIQNEKGELTGTGKVLDTASKAIGGSGVKPEAEMSAAEKMEKDTKVSWWEFGGKDKKIKAIKEKLDRGAEYSPEEAAVIKKNLGFDVPEESIKKSKPVEQAKPAEQEETGPQVEALMQKEPAKPEVTAAPEKLEPTKDQWMAEYENQIKQGKSEKVAKTLADKMAGIVGTGRSPETLKGGSAYEDYTKQTAAQIEPAKPSILAGAEFESKKIAGPEAVQPAKPTVSKSTESYNIANEPVIEGQELSAKQMAAIGMAKQMGNTYPDYIEKQYAKQLGAKASTEAVQMEPTSPGTISKREKGYLVSKPEEPKTAEPVKSPTTEQLVKESDKPLSDEPAKKTAAPALITKRDKSALFPEGGLAKAEEPAEPAKFVAVKQEKAAPGQPQKRDKSGLFSSEEPKAPTAAKLTGKQERELFSKNQDLYDKFKNYEEDIIDAEMAKFKKDPSYSTMSEEDRQKKFEAIKQSAGSQASAKFSKELEDVGVVKPSAEAETMAPPTQANAVYQQSAEVQAADKAPAAAPVVINAPQNTNVNNNSEFATRSPPRNTDSSYQQYNMGKFAF